MISNRSLDTSSLIMESLMDLLTLFANNTYNAYNHEIMTGDYTCKIENPVKNVTLLTSKIKLVYFLN